MLKKIVSFSVLVFGLLACSEDVKNVKNFKAKVDYELKTNKRTNDNLKIAFYHQDSMKLYFQYYKEQDSIFTKKNIDFQNKVAAKRKSM